MASFNKVLLIGRLTQDPELKSVGANNIPHASFTVAVDRPFKNQQGQHETDFVPCAAWRKLGETVANNLSKGRLVAVEGHLQTRTYQMEDGSKRRAFEVVADSVQFLDRPKNAEQSGAMVPAGGVVEDDAELPDDLPF